MPGQRLMSQVAKPVQRPLLIPPRIFEMRPAQSGLAMNAVIAAMSLDRPCGVLFGRYVFGVLGACAKAQPQF
jgi:hypothetical protein